MRKIQAKICVTKEYIYVYGDMTKKPVKIENRMNQEHLLIGEAFRRFEAENLINLRGKRKSPSRNKIEK